MYLLMKQELFNHLIIICKDNRDNSKYMISQNKINKHVCKLFREYFSLLFSVIWLFSLNINIL